PGCGPSGTGRCPGWKTCVRRRVRAKGRDSGSQGKAAPRELDGDLLLVDLAQVVGPIPDGLDGIVVLLRRHPPYPRDADGAGRGGEDDAPEARVRRPGEEVAGSLDVQIVHLARVGRVAAYQAGQMIEPLDTGKGAADRVGVTDVALDHLRVREWQAGAHEDAHVMSFLAQHRQQRGSQESSGAG